MGQILSRWLELSLLWLAYVAIFLLGSISRLFTRKRRKLKPGDKVVLVNCDEAVTYWGKIWTVSTKEWNLGNGERIVNLEGYGESVSVDCLRRIKDGKANA